MFEVEVEVVDELRLCPAAAGEREITIEREVAAVDEQRLA